MWPAVDSVAVAVAAAAAAVAAGAVGEAAGGGFAVSAVVHPLRSLR